MPRALRTLLGVVVTLAAALGLSGVWGFTGGNEQSCPSSAAVMIVDTAAHRLYLCQSGVVEDVYRVALGRGGVGKHNEGDRKTPLGTYALSEGRPSSRFKVFLPVGYPTEAQRALGYTGADIGVHGPDRRFTWLRRATVWFDWTAGCVAVATEREIKAISRWVRDTKAREIVIR